MTVPPLVWFTPTHCLFSPIRVLWKDRITLPVEIYELPVWYTITATAHHIIFPEGLLQPMSSHLYLWQFKRDLVRPHFDKSHLKLINMGDTLPPRLGFLRRDWDLHCHSTFIVWKEEEEEKGKEVRKERKGSGHMGQRRTEGEMKNHTGCHLGCRDWSRVPVVHSGLVFWEDWDTWKVPAQREGLMKHTRVDRSPDFMSHLLPL